MSTISLAATPTPNFNPILLSSAVTPVSTPTTTLFAARRSRLTVRTSSRALLCQTKILTWFFSITDQGKSVTITVTDRCEACKITDLDFSPTAFSQLADQSIGRISGMTWNWV